jgi:hypothetical protein
LSLCSRIGGGCEEELKEHEEHEGKSQEKHSRTSPITHPLDNQTHKITRYMNNQRERYKVEFISNPLGDEVLNPRWIFP